MSSELSKIINKFKKKSELRSFLKNNFSENEKKRLHKMIKFVELIRLGRSFNDSCKAIPVDSKTVRGWIQKAENAVELCDANDFDYIEHEDYMYIDFKSCLDEAEAEFKYRLQDCILNHSNDEWLKDEDGNKIQLLKKGDWKAAEKILKSRYPEEYGEKLDVTNKNEGNAQQTGVLIFPTINTSDMKLGDLSDITKSSQQFLINKVNEEED